MGNSGEKWPEPLEEQIPVAERGQCVIHSQILELLSSAATQSFAKPADKAIISY